MSEADDFIRMWELYPEFWKTEAAFLSFIRGGVRRHLWSKNPVKLQFIKERRVQIPNTNVKSMKRFPTVSGGVCMQCGNMFKEKDMEVDHIRGEHSLRCVADIQKFVEGIVFIRKEDLAYLCKPCHSVKTYSERYNVSLKEAAVEKRILLLIKEKNVVAFLVKRGILPHKNAAGRRKQCYDELMKEVSDV